MRRRLVLVSLAVTSMVALAFLVPLALLVRDVARDRALDAAERDAAAIAPALTVTLDPTRLATSVATTAAGADNRMTVHLPDGGTVGRAHERDEDVDLAVTDRRAFTRAADDGGVELYQPITLGKDEDGEDITAVVEVLVPEEDLTQGVVRSYLALGLVAVGLVAVAVVAADRLARSVVRPTKQLAGAAASLGQGDLDVRVQPDGPEEIAEVGHAFNTLAGRMQELLAAERERVADLSHRLRTPLTTLRLDADALTQGDGADRVRADADELERVVDELIHEARRPVRAGLGTCDVAELVRDRVQFWSALAEDQGRELELVVEGAPHVIPCDRVELVAALDALLGNVFDHTPEGTSARVSISRDPDGVTTVTVSDAGGGFADPAAAVARGTSGAGSTGLGVDIARRATEAAGGSIDLGRSDLGGAAVILRLGPAR